MNRKSLPPAETLRKFFSYNPETGELLHVKKTARGRPGAIAGALYERGYIRVTINRTRWAAGRVIWALHFGDCPADFDIDHINGDPSDNRIANLRLATRSQNTANQKLRSGGLPRGVSPHGNKFRAKITKNYKATHLGLFPSVDAAKAAYDAAAAQIHGEFTR